MEKRPNIARLIEKQIYKEFGSMCAFCLESKIALLEIHHITPYSMVKEHRRENLILLCANCHKKAKAGIISKKELMVKKRSAKLQATGQFVPSMPSNVVQFKGGENSGIIANVINIKEAKRRITKIAPPAGTIAADRDQRNYSRYLIDRYFKFKEAEIGKSRMIYPILYQAITHRFGAKWDLINSDFFDQLVQFLKDRIDKTILGRKQASSGIKRYSEFNEFIVKGS